MKAHPTLLQLKYDDVIEVLAKRAGVPVRKALDMFYRSPVYEEMSRGISDMHCRSDGYLADDIIALADASITGGDVKTRSISEISLLF